MHLSVIIATLSRPLTALALVARIAELFPTLNIEVIVVQPSTAPRPADTTRARFVNDSSRGVYRAYRAGLSHATGEYCWFMGDDDYPLDGATDLVPALLSAQADLLVAPVIFSSGWIYSPTRSHLVLHFLNWCQQGAIYRRRLLGPVRFFRRLSVQADQYVNIQLRADPSIRTVLFTRPICVFGIAGVSGRLRDDCYASLRRALARRTLSRKSYLIFCAFLLLRPKIKTNGQAQMSA
jgi:glycosyltransferase involved in cell wall biosynthesis